MMVALWANFEGFKEFLRGNLHLAILAGNRFCRRHFVPVFIATWQCLAAFGQVMILLRVAIVKKKSGDGFSSSLPKFAQSWGLMRLKMKKELDENGVQLPFL